MIVALSKGGSDAVTLREFDLDTKAFVADGFTLPEAKSGVEWIDADTLLLSSALGEGMATTSGYAKTVRLWRRGEPVERAPVLFEVPADRMAAYCSVDDTGANAADVVHRSDRFLQSPSLARHRGRSTHETRPADRHLAGSASGLAGREIARRLDGCGQDLRAGQRARHLALGLSGRRPQLHHGVRAAATAGVTGLFLDRRQARLVDPRRVAPGVRNLHAVGKRLDARADCRAFPKSAWSMSGVSTVTKPRAMATCSPMCRIR